MVRDAIELRQRTGIDALKLSPHQLSIEMQALRASDRFHQKELAEAVLVAMSGNEEVVRRFMSE